MRFTAPIEILYGPGGRRRTTGTITFTASSIHHARRVLKDGIVFGYERAAVKVEPKKST